MPTIVVHPGSLVFVTGVNGLVGSHIVDQLLSRGYNVRGAVRNVEKSQWLKEYFDSKGYEAKFDLVSVPDMTTEGCYDEVVKGAAGIIHVASPLNGDDPNIAIPLAVNGALNALTAASKANSVKRVVYTSSSIAATYPRPNEVFEINDQSWNEEGVEKGWKNEEGEAKGWNIYAALKTEAEKQACWKWVQENKPSFNFVSVLPNCNFGKVLVPEKQGEPSTIAWAKSAFTGQGFDRLKRVVTAQYFVSNQDCALVHVSALIHEDVKNERLLAFAEPYNWTKVLGVYKGLYPERQFPDPVEGEGVDKSVVKKGRAEDVLKWVKPEGQGWDGLEGALKEMSAQWV
ncbi:NAD(P)-binding protein [Lophiostoma macrostomum CBS 122681]|uniref:NAD(P)-binding protein n=1 Tax=Lophiostoma macrostomum CBS 122681 TaxID=1314788 RepID=A0A6A6TPB4_9PLEO|nr:NAD(P)-binding protein [Lophiostoma macrostomum CBS 122681]